MPPKKTILLLLLFYELVWQKCWCNPLESVCLILSRGIRPKLIHSHSLQNSHFISKQETRFDSRQVLKIQEFKTNSKLKKSMYAKEKCASKFLFYSPYLLFRSIPSHTSIWKILTILSVKQKQKVGEVIQFPKFIPEIFWYFILTCRYKA